MPYAAHRHGDARICGATTIVSGQSTVYVNNQLWAVQGDKNTHGEGALFPTTNPDSIYIEGKSIIVHGPDHAEPDDLCIPIGEPHCDPETAAGSGDTFAY